MLHLGRRKRGVPDSTKERNHVAIRAVLPKACKISLGSESTREIYGGKKQSFQMSQRLANRFSNDTVVYVVYLVCVSITRIVTNRKR
jgi:hypothetical protein